VLASFTGIGKVLAGDNQDVYRRLGIDVAKGDAGGVFIENLSGNLSGDDFAKEARIVGRGCGSHG
jgi:hypothetical protein